MLTEWQAHYVDGRSAARRTVTVRVLRTGLEIRGDDLPTRWWPADEIRLREGSGDGSPTCLERGGSLAEAIFIVDDGFLGALAQLAPELGRRLPRARRLGLLATLGAGVAIVALGAAAYVWGIPVLGAAAAAYVPPAWEARLGEKITNELAPAPQRCTSPQGTPALESLVTRLVRALGPVPYVFRVTVVDDATRNALAAPGGYILVFRGLLEQTTTAEQLAGVLAHEIAHVVHRHTTRLLLESASTSLLLSALTADARGLSSGLGAARSLGLLRYNRQSEAEADAEGARLLVAAGIEPGGLAAFLESVQADAEAPHALSYLSTHPATAERIASLRAFAAGMPPPGAPLMSDAEWQALRTICAGRPR